MANSVGFDDTEMHILPLLEDLSNDTEPAIKQILAEQLVPLGKLLAASGERGYKALVDILLPLTARLLEDAKNEVRQASATTLVELSVLVRADDLGQHVLTIVLLLAHAQPEKEEQRMTAAHLLNLLAERLGQDLCKQFIIPEVVSLAEDPDFRVRKSTALNFHNICRVGGEHELFERLMPAFVRLSKDDMYRVRRACAESVFAISEHVSDDIRRGVLVEIYLRFAQDPARLVKQSILQQAGMFISTLPPHIVNETILTNYFAMAADPMSDAIADAELKHYCAYSFPAVLQTIGGARWGELKDLYHQLIDSRSTEVRRSLAASLHEVARILADERVVEEELVLVFEELIQDVEVVQMGVMRHLAKFLAHLSVPCRISYLPEMHNILHATNPFNWRLRECLAVQLPALLDLPPPESVYVTLFPLVMTLLQDPVAIVRNASFPGVAKLLLILRDLMIREKDGENARWHEAHFENAVKAINGLALGEKYQLRQLWAELAPTLLKALPREVFETHFIDAILLLVMDRVSNVRVAVAELLTGWGPEFPAPWEPQGAGVTADATAKEPAAVANPWSWLLARDDVQECAYRLRKEDRDVFVCMQQLRGKLKLFPDMVIEMMTVRGMHTAPGGDEPIPNCLTGVVGVGPFRKRYAGDDRDSLSSSASSVDVEPVDLESAASKRHSGRVDMSSSLSAALLSDDVGEADVNRVGRPASPNLEEIELNMLLPMTDDRGTRLEAEENLSSDPEFLPVKDPAEALDGM